MTRVLVVDDDFMVARIHRGFVERTEGFEVVGTASSGAEALDLVRELQPDLVLLDLYLPDIFGLEVITQLRAAGETCDVLVITAAKEADSVRAAVRQGVVGYLLKPFSREDLRESLLHYERSYRRLDAEDTAEQQDVNRVFRRPGGTTTDDRLPKKLSPETADLIERTLREAGRDLSATECAEAVGLARVSVRRYLEHFVTAGQAQVRLRYGGVGRPERRYLWHA